MHKHKININSTLRLPNPTWPQRPATHPTMRSECALNLSSVPSPLPAALLLPDLLDGSLSPSPRNREAITKGWQLLHRPITKPLTPLTAPSLHRKSTKSVCPFGSSWLMSSLPKIRLEWRLAAILISPSTMHCRPKSSSPSLNKNQHTQ